MCGRVDIHTPPSELARALEAQLAAGVDPEGRPSWNVGPTRGVPAVVSDDEHRRVLDVFRWGLVPHWAKNPKVGYKMINARSETAATSNAYRKALQHRRCLVVADGFYEWAVPNPAEPKRKVPFYFRRADGQPITFAGLYETWWDKTRSKEPDADSYLQTCVIMTTDAGPDDHWTAFDLPTGLSWKGSLLRSRQWSWTCPCVKRSGRWRTGRTLRLLSGQRAKACGSVLTTSGFIGSSYGQPTPPETLRAWRPS